MINVWQISKKKLNKIFVLLYFVNIFEVLWQFLVKIRKPLAQKYYSLIIWWTVMLDVACNDCGEIWCHIWADKLILSGSVYKYGYILHVYRRKQFAGSNQYKLADDAFTLLCCLALLLLLLLKEASRSVKTEYLGFLALCLKAIGPTPRGVVPLLHGWLDR